MIFYRSAAKATIVLFPLLGLSNLLFLYNPGGVLDKYYVILNALFGSTQVNWLFKIKFNKRIKLLFHKINILCNFRAFLLQLCIAC